VHRHVDIRIEQDPPPAGDFFPYPSLTSISKERRRTRCWKKRETPAAIHGFGSFPPEQEADPEHRKNENRYPAQIDKEASNRSKKASTVQIRNHP
jgi:hypothetical protein